jgi:hypothetical protein
VNEDMERPVNKFNLNDIGIKIFFILFLLLSPKLILAEDDLLMVKDADVDLPLDSTKYNVSFQFIMNEETYTYRDLKKLVPRYATKHFDTSIYNYISENTRWIDFYVIFPCNKIDTQFISKSNIPKGFLLFDMQIKYENSSYVFELTNFEWLDEKKVVRSISKMYKNYKTTSDIKERKLYYGALKTAEYLIAKTLNKYTDLVDELIENKLQFKEHKNIEAEKQKKIENNTEKKSLDIEKPKQVFENPFLDLIKDIK